MRKFSSFKGVFYFFTITSIVLSSFGCRENERNLEGSTLSGSSGCSGLCQRIIACFPGQITQTECAQECELAAQIAGELAQTAISLCSDCIARQGCSGFENGSCDESCFLDYDTSGLCGQCNHVFDSSDRDYEVRCDRECDEDTYQCRCFENNLEGYWFDSLNFCSATEEEKILQANSGCYWDL